MSYLNLNDTKTNVGINWETDCLDKGDHLNVSGAEKVSNALGTYLKEQYALPDHRGEKAYASWDTLAEQYDTLVDEKIRELRQ